MDLPTEALEAFEHLKAACLQAPILAFPNFDKPFLLETDASGKGLGLFFLRSRLMDATILSRMRVGL